MTLSIRNCPFAFRCDRQWSGLQRTAAPSIRFCNDCQREVHRCDTDEELALAVALNHCVAIRVEAHLGDLGGRTVGIPIVPPPYE